MAKPTVSEELLDISVVTERSGVPASTLRLWEDRGLISPAGRAGLRRQYDPDVLTTIAVIVISQRSGFSLNEIGQLLEPGAFTTGKHLLEAKLIELRERRAELDTAIESLEHGLACPAPAPLDCPSFQALLSDVLPR